LAAVAPSYLVTAPSSILAWTELQEKLKIVGTGRTLQFPYKVQDMTQSKAPCTGGIKILESNLQFFFHWLYYFLEVLQFLNLWQGGRMTIMTNNILYQRFILNEIKYINIRQYYTARKTSLNFGDPFFNLYTAFLFNSAMLCWRCVNTAAAIIYQRISLTAFHSHIIYYIRVITDEPRVILGLGFDVWRKTRSFQGLQRDNAISPILLRTTLRMARRG
jgi:hypothetical protein